MNEKAFHLLTKLACHCVQHESIDMNIQGYYINLDNSIDRRRLIEANLAQEGMGEYFTRFSACRGDDRPATITPGELGCYLSHQAIIESARDDSHTFILEDDAILPPGFRKRFFSIMNNIIDQPWDIVFLCQVVGFHELPLLANLISIRQKLQAQQSETQESQYALLDASTYYSWSTAAYVIRAGAQEKIRQCLKHDSAHTYHQPIDALYHHAVRDGRIIAKCVMPYQVGIRDIETTLSDRANMSEHYLNAMLVNLFVEGMNPSPLYEKARSGFDQPPLNGSVFVISQMHYRILLDMIQRADAGP